MKTTLAILAVVGGVGHALNFDHEFTTELLGQENHHGLFQQWRKKFEKVYENIEEESRRFGIFSDNLKRIAAMNDEGHSFKVAANQFADLTDDEFHDIYSCGGDYMDSSKPIKMLSPEERQVRKVGDRLGATSVDWTTKGVVTPVKNQGQCGSCWAFSTTGSLECDYAIKTGKLTSLSEQQLVDCSGSYGNDGCNGGWYYNGWEYAKSEGGLCTEDSYPYKGVDGVCKASSCGTKYNQPSGYTKVRADDESALETGVDSGCVSVAIQANQFAFQYYSSGVLDGTCGTRIDHAVLVVGYGVDGSQEYWKVKNSWGTSWGEDGYVLICRDCNKNGNEGECGIDMYPMYPNF